MKALLGLIIGTFLLATPAMAAKEKAKPAPLCISMEQAEANIKKQGFKTEHKFIGDELAKINGANTKVSGAEPPKGQTGFLVMSHPKLSVFVGVILVNGCVTKATAVNPEYLKKIMEADDGSL